MNQSPPSTRRTWIVPAAIVAVAVVAVAIILWGPGSGTDEEGGSAAQPTPAATASASAVPTPTAGDGPDAAAPPTTEDTEAPDMSDVERRDPDDPLAHGPADAPVALVVFSDYQCPYCAKWATDTLPVMEEYVERGDLRIEFRDVNVFGEASERGSRAAYAAALQGEFSALHEALFEKGMAAAPTQLTDEYLADLAAELGLDQEQFAADYDSDETAAAVARNQELGLDIGAFSTPSFVLAGQPMVGAQPTEVFVDLVEAALAAQTGGE